MGLIKAAFAATGGTLADQWKEFFYCDALDSDVLAAKGKKRTSSRSSNTKGDDNVISSGSGMRCSGRTVYDNRGTGAGGGSLYGTGRIHL